MSEKSKKGIAKISVVTKIQTLDLVHLTHVNQLSYVSMVDCRRAFSCGVKYVEKSECDCSQIFGQEQSISLLDGRKD